MPNPAGPLDFKGGTYLGDATCTECGEPIKVKVNKNGYAYAFCIETEGGCGYAVQCRSARSTEMLLARITEWKHGYKKRCAAALGHVVEPDDEPDDEPDFPDDDPDDEPDPEPQPEPRPAPKRTPPKRAAPKRPAPKRRAPPRSKTNPEKMWFED